MASTVQDSVDKAKAMTWTSLDNPVINDNSRAEVSVDTFPRTTEQTNHNGYAHWYDIIRGFNGPVVRADLEKYIEIHAGKRDDVGTLPTPLQPKGLDYLPPHTVQIAVDVQPDGSFNIIKWFHFPQKVTAKIMHRAAYEEISTIHWGLNYTPDIRRGLQYLFQRCGQWQVVTSTLSEVPRIWRGVIHHSTQLQLQPLS